MLVVGDTQQRNLHQSKLQDCTLFSFTLLCFLSKVYWFRFTEESRAKHIILFDTLKMKCYSCSRRVSEALPSVKCIQISVRNDIMKERLYF